MFNADNLYLDYVGKDTFYGYLALNRERIFTDEQFASLYCPDNGRTSVPPSTLAVMLLLQAHDRVSDEEAISSSRFDLRWKVALGIGINECPCAKSTLQEFRAKLIIHEKQGEAFLTSLQEAKRLGFLGRKKKLKVVLDTTPIFGKGAVRDTYNLLADGIVKLVRALAKSQGIAPQEWANTHDLSRYFASSIKGAAEIDWSDKAARGVFLASIVADAKRLLEESKQVVVQLGPEQSREIVEAADLLCRLLLQDIEEKGDDSASIKKGVAKDRIVSTTDPEMRHGRKSKATRFDGHKADVAVEPESQLITAVDVIAGNAHDSEGALELVRQSEENTGCEVEKVVGDCAFGGGETRREFEEEGIELAAKVPRAPENGRIPKSEFEIDLENDTVTCPEGHVCKTYETATIKTSKNVKHKVKRFVFDAQVCNRCPRYGECVKSKKGKGRTVTLHYEEALLQEARRYQKTPEFREDNKARQTVEHRIARLVQLGIRKSRFFGRKKTLFQVLMAAAVANFTLIVSRLASGDPFFGAAASLCFLLWLLCLLRLWNRAWNSSSFGFGVVGRISDIMPRAVLPPAKNRPFRPDF
jgi:hypothetical protein